MCRIPSHRSRTSSVLFSWVEFGMLCHGLFLCITSCCMLFPLLIVVGVKHVKRVNWKLYISVMEGLSLYIFEKQLQGNISKSRATNCWANGRKWWIVIRAQKRAVAIPLLKAAFISTFSSRQAVQIRPVRNCMATVAACLRQQQRKARSRHH